MPKYVQILGKVSAHSGTSKYISLRVTQADNNLVNPLCQFQDPLFNKGEMVDVSLMGELVEVVRHARQGAEICGILLRHRLTDVAVYGKLIDEGRQRALPVLAPSQQLRVVALVEIHLDGILPFLPLVRPWATALVLLLFALGCLGIIHIFDCSVWHGRLLSRGFSGRKTYTCSPNTQNFLLRRGNQDCCAAGKGNEGRQIRGEHPKGKAAKPYRAVVGTNGCKPLSVGCCRIGV